MHRDATSLDSVRGLYTVTPCLDFQLNFNLNHQINSNHKFCVVDHLGQGIAEAWEEGN